MAVARTAAILPIALLAALAVGVPVRSQPAASDAATPWTEHQHARTRLIVGQSAAPGEAGVPVEAGWEIMLEDGWKTYWRSPGDAGRPPVLTAAKAENVAEIGVAFPLPERFSLFGIDTFGYGEHLILPLTVRPERAGEPMRLALAADFMICADICIPMTADYALDLAAAQDGAARPTPFADDIARFRARVPDTRGGGGAGLAIGSVRVRGPNGNQRLLVDAKGAQPFAEPALLVETPDAFVTGRPESALLADGSEVRFVVPVETVGDAASLAGREIVLTVSDGLGHAIERRRQVSP